MDQSNLLEVGNLFNNKDKSILAAIPTDISVNYFLDENKYILYAENKLNNPDIFNKTFPIIFRFSTEHFLTFSLFDKLNLDLNADFIIDYEDLKIKKIIFNDSFYFIIIDTNLKREDGRSLIFEYLLSRYFSEDLYLLEKIFVIKNGLINGFLSKINSNGDFLLNKLNTFSVTEKLNLLFLIFKKLNFFYSTNVEYFEIDIRSTFLLKKEENSKEYFDVLFLNKKANPNFFMKKRKLDFITKINLKNKKCILLFLKTFFILFDDINLCGNYKKSFIFNEELFIKTCNIVESFKINSLFKEKFKEMMKRFINFEDLDYNIEILNLMTNLHSIINQEESLFISHIFVENKSEIINTNEHNLVEQTKTIVNNITNVTNILQVENYYENQAVNNEILINNKPEKSQEKENFIPSEKPKPRSLKKILCFEIIKENEFEITAQYENQNFTRKNNHISEVEQDSKNSINKRLNKIEIEETVLIEENKNTIIKHQIDEEIIIEEKRRTLINYEYEEEIFIKEKSQINFNEENIEFINLNRVINHDIEISDNIPIINKEEEIDSNYNLNSSINDKLIKKEKNSNNILVNNIISINEFNSFLNNISITENHVTSIINHIQNNFEKYESYIINNNLFLNIMANKFDHSLESTSFSYSISGSKFLVLDDLLSKIEESNKKLQEAEINYNNNNFILALELFESCLELRIRSLGMNNKETGIAMTGLGGVLMKLGRYKEAIEIYHKAIIVYEKSLGEGNILIASVLHNIGLIYDLMNVYDKAMDYYKKALKIKIEKLGEFNSSTGRTYYNIGGIYDILGNFEEALKIYLLTIQIYDSSLGESNVDSATVYNNIGLVYDKINKSEDSIKSYLKSLKISLSILGDVHPLVATSYNNLGLVLFKINRMKEAIENFEKSILIRENLSSMGYLNSDTASSYNNLAGIYYKLGDFEISYEKYQKSLEINLKLIGEMTPETATAFNNLGLVCVKLNKHQEALSYFQKSLIIKSKLFGEDDLECISVEINIAGVYFKINEFEICVKSYMKALKSYSLIYGENSPELIKLFSNLGHSYNNLSKLDQAFECYTKSLQICLFNFGEDSYYSADAYFNLSHYYDNLGQTEKANEYFMKSYSIKENINNSRS